MKTPLYILHAPADAHLSEPLLKVARQTLPEAEIAAEAMGEDTIGLVHEAGALLVVLNQSGLLSGAGLHAVGYAQGLGKPAGIVLQDNSIAETLRINLNEDLLQRADDPAGIVELLRGLATRSGIPCPALEAAPAPQEATTGRSPLSESVRAQSALDEESEQTPVVPDQPTTAWAETSAKEEIPAEMPDSTDSRPSVQSNQDATQPRWSRPPGTVTLPSTSSSPVTSTGTASAAAALAAGQALAEHGLRPAPAPASPEFHNNFGRFMSALGGNWDALAKLEDAELWAATAENLLEAPEIGTKNLQAWFDLGQGLTTLLHLASSDHQDDETDTQGPWNAAMKQFLAAGTAADLAPGTIAIIEGSLENLQGPESGRDYSGVAQLQQTLRAQAMVADGN